MAGSTLLSSVYGYEVTSADDALVQIVETAVNPVLEAALPGSKSSLKFEGSSIINYLKY